MEQWMYDLPTPCYVVDEERLKNNLRILKDVMDQSGCRILLAQKAFSMFSLYPLISRTLSGTACSGLFEAKLGAAYFRGENHVYAPAYKDEEFDDIARLCGHLVFNSMQQYRRFGARAKASGCSVGLRINPECSTQAGKAIYDPCAPFSRLGIPASEFLPQYLDGIDGLHLHTLCEQNADALIVTLRALEGKLGDYLASMQWLNLGGGHHITREDYDRDTLVRELVRLRETYGVQVYLEPGEAVVLNAGYLIARVLDIVHNGMDIAILDASAACHMPDVIEVPYRPDVIGAALPGEKPHTYRLGGPTCLAGDVIGDYSFDAPLRIGNTIAFCDMAHYTMVKNNTFNGMNLPAIAIHEANGTNTIVRRFGYEDFLQRLS